MKPSRSGSGSRPESGRTHPTIENNPPTESEPTGTPASAGERAQPRSVTAQRAQFVADLWAKIREHKVVQWTLGYLALAYTLLHGAEMLSEALDWQHDVVRIFTIVLVLGVPVVAVLAWYHGSRSRRRASGTELVILSIIFAAGAVLLWTVWTHWHAKKTLVAVGSAPSISSDPAALPDKSVAVLPLLNLSGDDKDSYLGDGISGEILSALSKVPGLRVIGRASSFQFRDHDVDVAKVGRVLGVRSLLTGTVQRAGDKLRISVELIDTTSGVQLWSQHFDRSFENLFTLEDDISGAVSTALAVQLGAQAGQPLVHVATASAHAHDLYLRAKQLSYRSEASSLDQAVRLFNQAIAEDPNYAAAWAALANTYLFLADAYRAPIELLPVMKGAAEKAVALDPKLAEAHAYLSYILLGYQRDFPAAEREMEKAVALNPGSADVQFFLGINRILTRRATGAQLAFLMAEKLDPLNPFVPFVEIWTATALGEFDTAIQKAQRTLVVYPTFFYFTDPLVLAYGNSGRWKECVARYVETQSGLRAGAGNGPDYKAAVCYAHLGENEHARLILAQLEKRAQQSYSDRANIAEVYVALGEKETAFESLERAFNDRSQPLLNVWFGPEFRTLYNDPRYQALMDRIYFGLQPSAAP